MTTIVWHDGTFYADTQITLIEIIQGADGKITEHIVKKEIGEKIIRAHGKLYAYMGLLEIWELFVSRNYSGKIKFHIGRNLGHISDWVPIDTAILEWDGKYIKQWTYREFNIGKYYATWFSLKKARGKFTTFLVGGTGQEYAWKILNKNGTPEEAIKYAALYDEYTNDNIQIEHL